ncbi:hypothetical protein [Levilactobacillus enshiensis]|uniref:hypothetical protein n=1 Tax=Levilactobacillus enshiensis TaxID=2590213 RepID=UPI00117B17D3|nr:hypothetical protein [Levilactobacillus enshiensis]
MDNRDIHLHVLRLLDGHKNSEAKPLKEVMKFLVGENHGEKWANDILISMDIKHDALINLEFIADAQNQLGLGNYSNSENYLTSKGQRIANL